MQTEQTTSGKRYLTILSDGKFHQEVPEGTEGAVVREYKKSTGQKGSKTELVFGSVSGKITGVSFFDGDFNKTLQIKLDNNGVVSVNTKSDFGTDLMRKLPNVDLSESVTLKPYSFEDDNGKLRRGVTVEQGGNKLSNYYFQDGKSVNGMPEPDGDTSAFDADDWTHYFAQVRKFLIAQVEENIVSKFSN